MDKNVLILGGRNSGISLYLPSPEKQLDSAPLGRHGVIIKSNYDD